MKSLLHVFLDPQPLPLLLEGISQSGLRHSPESPRGAVVGFLTGPEEESEVLSSADAHGP